MILRRTDRYSGRCSTCSGRARRRCTRMDVLDPNGEDQIGDEIRVGLIALINVLHAERILPRCRQRGWLFSFLALKLIHAMTYLYSNWPALILCSYPLAFCKFC
jgi:hypothetical protein